MIACAPLIMVISSVTESLSARNVRLTPPLVDLVAVATGLMPTDEGTAGAPWFEVASLSDVGTERDHNEDHCGSLVEGEASAVVVVADGVSSAEAGELASHKAVETTLRAFQEEPAGTAAAKRLLRAVQRANIEIYDLAMVVPELRGMTTTVTAIALD